MSAPKVSDRVRFNDKVAAAFRGATGEVIGEQWNGADRRTDYVVKLDSPVSVYSNSVKVSRLGAGAHCMTVIEPSEGGK